MRRSLPTALLLFVLPLACTPAQAQTEQRLICEQPPALNAGGTPRLDLSEVDAANRQALAAASRAPLGVGIGFNRGYYGGFDGYGDQRQSVAALVAANQRLATLVDQLSLQVDALQQQLAAPRSLVCRPMGAEQSTTNAPPTSADGALAQARAAVDQAGVFNYPGPGAPQVGALRLNETVTIHARRDGWVRITAPDAAPGWVREALLAPIP
ncbi:SH3 domain-containing protein [Halotalea alkalilenta]|uniref:SH3 domain-containing protein n=1 Tax=Halotalea alkalilenta TaxID=376489 RepID=UPI00047FFD6D|nr:SH3 domain-containing protein [Halotalea alkalilenta]